MNRKVNYAKVHQGIFVPECGELGQTLPPVMKTMDLNMLKVDGGLLLSISRNGKHWDVFIPDGNIALAVFAPEDKATLKAVGNG